MVPAKKKNSWKPLFYRVCNFWDHWSTWEMLGFEVAQHFENMISVHLFLGCLAATKEKNCPEDSEKRTDLFMWILPQINPLKGWLDGWFQPIQSNQYHKIRRLGESFQGWQRKITLKTPVGHQLMYAGLSQCPKHVLVMLRRSPGGPKKTKTAKYHNDSESWHDSDYNIISNKITVANTCRQPFGIGLGHSFQTKSLIHFIERRASPHCWITWL